MSDQNGAGITYPLIGDLHADRAGRDGVQPASVALSPDDLAELHETLELDVERGQIVAIQIPGQPYPRFYADLHVTRTPTRIIVQDARSGLVEYPLSYVLTLEQLKAHHAELQLQNRAQQQSD